jgi:hypothetical protein
VEAAKIRHYFLLGLLFFMLVPVPIFYGAIYLCVTKNKDVPWFLVLWNIFFYGLVLCCIPLGDELGRDSQSDNVRAIAGTPGDGRSTGKSSP